MTSWLEQESRPSDFSSLSACALCLSSREFLQPPVCILVSISPPQPQTSAVEKYPTQQYLFSLHTLGELLALASLRNTDSRPCPPPSIGNQGFLKEHGRKPSLRPTAPQQPSPGKLTNTHLPPIIILISHNGKKKN